MRAKVGGFVIRDFQIKAAHASDLKDDDVNEKVDAAAAENNDKNADEKKEQGGEEEEDELLTNTLCKICNSKQADVASISCGHLRRVMMKKNIEIKLSSLIPLKQMQLVLLQVTSMPILSLSDFRCFENILLNFNKM